MGPLDHYLTYGRREGRAGCREDEADAARIRRFNSAFYIDRYPDVAKTGADPLDHFIERGLPEGRLGSIVDSLEADEPAWQPSPDRLCLNASGALVRVSSQPPSWVSKPDQRDVGPMVSIVVIAQGVDPAKLVEGINSVIDQSYPHWEIRLLYAGGDEKPERFKPEDFGTLEARIDVSKLPLGSSLAREVNAAVTRANGSVLLLVDGADALAPHALHHFVKAMRAETQACVCYGDEIFIDADGNKIEQDFKPDFSPEYLESGMYLPPCVAMPRSLFLEIGGYRENLAGAELFDLMLRVSASKAAIVHIPLVLSRGEVANPLRAGPPQSSSLKALSEHLKASGRGGTVEPGLIEKTYRVRDAIPAGLPVTLLIFTDNRSAALGERGTINLYDNFLGSILRATETRCRYRVLAVDNGNLALRQHERTETTGGRVISHKQEAGARSISQGRPTSA
ncbi:Glycosyl transferase family 2 (fragment) [Beijerinckiaceae bacterium RH AL1]